MQDSDMPFLWAAYQGGTWSDVLPEGMGPLSFNAAMEGIIGRAQFDWIIDAPGDGSVRPIGLVLANTLAGGRGIEPHVDWFPWTTPRNRVEGVAVFIREVSRQFKLYIFSTEEDRPFWFRFCRWRMLKRGGQIDDHFARGEHGMLFHTPGP